MHNKHSYQLLIKHCLRDRDYEHGDKANFHVISNKFKEDALYCHRSNDVINYFPNNNNNVYHIFNHINKEP